MSIGRHSDVHNHLRQHPFLTHQAPKDETCAKIHEVKGNERPSTDISPAPTAEKSVAVAARR
jgi:hypothetical protein